ncbi:adenosine receptor A2b-like [Montipora capricornis]|uniref:adenosine receptor A2b-like n=1 Tax=Montipora capricornis TaxID=246305 RepID=UPI0035F11990
MEPNTTDLCLNCVPDDCIFGLNTMATVIFIILCLVCGVLAIAGNLALLVALSRTTTFQSRANYVFVISLAVADFFVGLTMSPLYISYALAFDLPWLIKLEGFLWIVSVTATTYSLSAVSLDRLISVVFPLRYPQVMTDKRCKVIITLIWIGAVIFGIPRLILDDFTKLEKLWISCSVATVAIPLLVMSLSYGKIFSVVQKANRSIGDHSTQSSVAVLLGNRKAVQTIGIIVGLFILTFTPTVVVYFMLLFEEDPCKELELNDVWLWVALVSFSHSSFNPWVYGLRYRELRNAIRDLFLNHPTLEAVITYLQTLY